MEIFAALCITVSLLIYGFLNICEFISIDLQIVYRLFLYLCKLYNRLFGTL